MSENISIYGEGEFLFHNSNRFEGINSYWVRFILLIVDIIFGEAILLNRLIALLIFILIVSSSTCLGLNQVDNNQEELPDLVGSINIYEKDGSYWYNFSISNIGNTKADHYNVTTTVYPFGTFLFRNKIMDFIGKISPQLCYLVAFPFKYILHLYPYFIERRGQDSPNPIYPDDTFTFDSWGPFDYETGMYLNSRTCLILECIVDPNNTVKESNEQNNREVIRWWFPLRNEPPE